MTEITQKIHTQTKVIKHDKVQFETAVIGAAVLEPNCLPRIIDLLDSKNFTGINAHLWQAILQLHGKRAIDLQTVCHQAVLNTDIDPGLLANRLADAASRVNSAANVEVHALTILELDIATKFYDLVANHKTTQESKVFEAIVAEVLDALYQDKDKLKTLEDALAYMQTVDPNNDLTIKVKEFHDGIQAKADRILKRERIRLSLEVLHHLHTGSGCDRAILESTNLLIEIINSRKVPVGFSNEVIKLKNMVSQYNSQ